MRRWMFVVLEVRRDDLAAELMRTLRVAEIVSHFVLSSRNRLTKPMTIIIVAHRG